MISPKAFENIFNHLLMTDPAGKQALSHYAGRTIGFDVRGTGIKLLSRINNEGMTISSDSLEQADCVLSGRPIALIRYLNTRNVNPSTNVSLGVELKGDLDLAIRISTVLKNLNIDWTEIFAGLIGDLPAHQLTSVLSSLRSNLDKTAIAAKNNLRYIITERLDQVVLREEAEDFYRQVDIVSAHAQCLEKQVDSLERSAPDG